ncbi:Molybdenum transport system permease protein ModB [Corynebacterium provencense]|uniref:Molybdenum transport system permease protein ModB n=1 Tax=Corynebacterium provencense TaxID=1737425 RepID=A0A2Z3YS87_9CORY|nr:molybdenum ABC transporter permease [Corynebacterium provencense]AWT25434.1 Molybdenum transport system permease protein ModB [Corynebacterium provencense]
MKDNRSGDGPRAATAVPAALVVVAFVAVLFLLGPLVALLLNIPWARAVELVTGAGAVEAFGLSLTTAAVSTVLCIVLGLPLSLWLVELIRRRPPLGDAVTLVVYAPLVLSPVVSGLSLVFLWGRHGLIGEWLDMVAGVRVAFTPLAVIVVQVFVSLPFFVSTTVTSLRAVPAVVQEAARVDGASRWQVLGRITVPLAGPGIAAGTVLGFARALSEYGATLTFAGNVAGETRTIPLLIELGLSSNDMDQALGACILLLGIYVLVVGGIATTTLLGRRR